MKQLNRLGIVCAVMIVVLAVSCSDAGYESIKENLNQGGASGSGTGTPGTGETENNGGSGGASGSGAENSGSVNTEKDTGGQDAVSPEEEGMTIQEATEYVKTLYERKTIKVRGPVSGEELQLFSSTLFNTRIGAIRQRRNPPQVDLDLSRVRDLVRIPDDCFATGSAGRAGSALTSIILPEGLTEIGRNSFANAAIESIVLPASLQFIRERGIYANEKLGAVYFKGSTPPQSGKDVFMSLWVKPKDTGLERGVIYVPAGTEDAYRKALTENSGFNEWRKGELQKLIKPTSNS